MSGGAAADGKFPAAENLPNARLSARLVSECLGTALLLSIVVGSGIMAERLSAGNSAVALLANALATGAGLFALITVFGPVSGAQFNPVVSLAALWRRELNARDALAYAAMQFAGAVAGVAAAHLMFGEPVLLIGNKPRDGLALCFSEFIATFGLLLTLFGARGRRIETVAALVGAYITAAYWFTASTSFANPAVTLARGFTQSFAGIRIGDVPGFMLAQLLAVPAALVIDRICLRHRQAPG